MAFASPIFVFNFSLGFQANIRLVSFYKNLKGFTIGINIDKEILNIIIDPRKNRLLVLQIC